MNFKKYLESKIEINGGIIEINDNPQFSPRKQSVVNLFVPEEYRNQGIGNLLIQTAKKQHNDLGAQVSSTTSLKLFYKNGFRNPEYPHYSLTQHLELFQNNGHSLFLAANDNNGNPYVK